MRFGLKNKLAWAGLIGGLALMAGALWTATSFDKAQAQNAKNTGIVGDNLMQITSGGSVGPWATILAGDIQTSNAEDAVYDVSIECGLYTDTTVKSKGGTADTSKAEAMVEVRVLVDGEEAHPGIVKFCSRAQTLMAKFGGVLNCSDVNGDGVITFDECTLTDEELQLILETVNANAFNYFSLNLPVGPHHIDVQARVTTDKDFQAGSAVAKAWVGKGTVAVDEVKMVKSTTMP